MQDNNPKLTNDNLVPWAVCRYSFDQDDVNQWAAWGVDYLKYDWNPSELPETTEMYNALRNSGRDIIFSLSNSIPFSNAAPIGMVSNSYRTDGDISDSWSSVTSEISKANQWAPYAGPGHWSDPDMMEIGNGGLTPDEETTHFSMWCLLEAPLILGTNMTTISAFDLSLAMNAEVIAIDQDALGIQAVPVAGSITSGSAVIYEKSLEDGSKAVGLINTSGTSATISVSWGTLGISGNQTVRDLWRQENLGTYNGSFSSVVDSDGIELVRIIPPLMISTVVNQEIAPGTSTAPLYLTVTDTQASVSAAVVTATSSNPGLAPQSGLALSGSGANWILTATPTAGLTGSANITLSVNDGISTATNSFAVVVNTPPAISSIPTQLVNENTTVGPLSFTVSDAETPANSLVVTATSTNNTFVPTGNITLGGSGTNRTITVTPANYSGGTTTIILSVSDGIDTRWSAFSIWTYLPSISSGTSQNITTNSQSGALPFTIGDSRVEPYILAMSASSSNTMLIPASGLAWSGTGTIRSLTITPASNQNGTAIVTAYVSDGVNAAPSSILVTVSGSGGNPNLFISPVDTQYVEEGGTLGPIALMASGTGTLVITASSSNPALIPSENVIIQSASNPWLNTDVGTVSTAGNTIPGDVFTQWASGADISGTADGGQLIYQPVSGDGEIIARVTSVGNTNVAAKAGVMMRASTASNAAFADAIATPGQGVKFEYRSTAGASSTIADTVAGIEPPIWLSLVKSGTSFTAFYAQDNNGAPGTWVEMGGTDAVGLSGTYLEGMMSTAHNNTAGVLGISTYDMVSGSNGSGVLNTGANQSMTIVPSPGTTGTANVTVTVSSGASSDATSFQVVVNAAPLSPVESWREQYFGTTQNSGNAADLANPAGDGIVNLVKYALGMNPDVNSQSGLPVMSVNGGTMEIQFNRNTAATDVTYYIQASDDLVNWTTIATWAAGGSSWAQSGATVTDNSGAVTAADNTPVGAQTHRFLQVVVSGP